jgi:hypothetical protein
MIKRIREWFKHWFGEEPPLAYIAMPPINLGDPIKPSEFFYVRYADLPIPSQRPLRRVAVKPREGEFRVGARKNHLIFSEADWNAKRMVAIDYVTKSGVKSKTVSLGA